MNAETKIRDRVTKIATLAADPYQDNPTKPKVGELILECIKQDRQPDDWEWAKIYSYFVDNSRPRQVKTPWEWLQKHRGRKNPRLQLNCIYSDGKRNLATDINRLAVVEPSEPLPEGFYDDLGQSIEIVGKFPDVDRVIPNHEEEITLSKKGALTQLEQKLYDSKIQVINIAGDVWIQLKYLKDTLSIIKDDDLFCVGYSEEGPMEPIKITFPDYPEMLALIMPIRV